MNARAHMPVLLAVCAMVTAACGSSPATRVHLLSAPPEAAAHGRFDASVGVGPVTVPEYLDRLQVVARTASGGIAISDTQRWSEPPGEGLTRVLAEALSARLGAAEVVRFPWARSQAPDLRVPVEVLRFEYGPDDAVRLEARWSVQRRDGTAAIGPRTSRIDLPSTGEVDARVRAHGEAAARLADEIAAGLRTAGSR